MGKTIEYKGYKIIPLSDEMSKLYGYNYSIRLDVYSSGVADTIEEAKEQIDCWQFAKLKRDEEDTDGIIPTL